MTTTKNMAKYYKNAHAQLLSAKPNSIKKIILENPYGREAQDLAHEVAKLAEGWEYDDLDENGCDWENNNPF